MQLPVARLPFLACWHSLHVFVFCFGPCHKKTSHNTPKEAQSIICIENAPLLAQPPALALSSCGFSSAHAPFSSPIRCCLSLSPAQCAADNARTSVYAVGAVYILYGIPLLFADIAPLTRDQRGSQPFRRAKRGAHQGSFDSNKNEPENFEKESSLKDDLCHQAP